MSNFAATWPFQPIQSFAYGCSGSFKGFPLLWKKSVADKTRDHRPIFSHRFSPRSWVVVFQKWEKWRVCVRPRTSWIKKDYIFFVSRISTNETNWHWPVTKTGRPEHNGPEFTVLLTEWLSLIGLPDKTNKQVTRSYSLFYVPAHARSNLLSSPVFQKKLVKFKNQNIRKLYKVMHIYF